MGLAFITIRVIDIIDILLVAFLMYQLYSLIKGTAAFNIFVAIISLYLLYLIVKSSNMKMLSSILGAVIGGGVIALLIVFQQEIRRFLIFIGTRYFPNKSFSLENFLSKDFGTLTDINIEAISHACSKLAQSKTGALIAIAQKISLKQFADSGDIIDANTTSRLIETIFNKYSLMHDGALIIDNNKIHAARCVLPFSDKQSLPSEYGMRHRAGLGLSEATDAFVIIISEETGKISIAHNGDLININEEQLKKILIKIFTSQK